MIGVVRLAEVAEFISAKHRGANMPFQVVSTDTRTLQPGDLYVALTGDRLDGHDYIQQAIEKGACAVVISKAMELSVPTLLVQDTTKALGLLALFNRNKFTKEVVAVTGSSGKTTVKGMLATLLRQQNEVLVTRGNFNNHIGAPITLLRLNEIYDCAVVELGASAEGEIAYTSNLTKPFVSILTNAEESHLEGFGDLATIVRTKGEIIDALPENGYAILNADSPYFDIWNKRAGSKNVLSFGVSQQASVRASDIEIDVTGCCGFTMHIGDQVAYVQLRVMGQHNAMNALASAAACHALKMPLPVIVSGLEAFEGVEGRLLEKAGLNGSRVIDDTYNANPASVRAAIDVLGSRPGRKIFVLGDMAELGVESQLAHAESGVYARHGKVDEFFALGTFSRGAADAFGDNAHWFASHDTLINFLKTKLNSDTTVLVKGSRSARMDRVVSEIIDLSDKNK
ncbi:MAG: UDP-N-acetylmuramoyl-tripeptide--D-alanyl-D-alanine ligase [Crocinitomicaceae bacterium]|jgi:UDP-N-acetylmuramoyl-tripeptide--D-alanyl-D-alanine ligase